MSGLTTGGKEDHVIADTRCVEVRGLKKSFGYHRVLNGLNFALKRGERLVVLGRNGCGKTTLINIAGTLLHPSQGQVIIGGLDARRQAVMVRRQLGFVGHTTMLYNELTLRENLRFYGRMYGVNNLEKRIAELVALLELQKWQDRRVGVLSRSIQQRTAIARALIHDPPVLLLDEPESGLDPAAFFLLYNLMASRATQGSIILATTHNLEFARQAGNRLAILSEGRFVYEADYGQIDLPALKNIFDQYAGMKHEAVN